MARTAAPERPWLFAALPKGHQLLAKFVKNCDRKTGSQGHARMPSDHYSRKSPMSPGVFLDLRIIAEHQTHRPTRAGCTPRQRWTVTGGRINCIQHQPMAVNDKGRYRQQRARAIPKLLKPQLPPRVCARGDAACSCRSLQPPQLVLPSGGVGPFCPAAVQPSRDGVGLSDPHRTGEGEQCIHGEMSVNL